MTGTRITRRLATVAVFVLVALGVPSVALAQTTEIPGIEVTAALPATVHQAETFAVTFELTNTGATAFDNVVVAAQDACAPSSTGGLLGFTEVQGNGDALFDPAEVWSYLAPRCIDSGTPAASIAVTASDGVDTLTGTYVFGYTPEIPLAIDLLGDVSADPCLRNSFDFPFTLVSPTPSQFPVAFLAYAIPLQGGGYQIVDETEFTEINFVSENGNAQYDPGEEFLARFHFGTLIGCVEHPEAPLVLFLSMAGVSADSDATWCFGTAGCPTPALEVGTIVDFNAEQIDPEFPSPGPDPTTEVTLPFTGPESSAVTLLGVALLAAGALVLAATRKTSD